MYIKFLQDLISFPSVTPSSNGSIEYLNDLLAQSGFKTTIKIFGEDAYQVTNLYAVYGEARPNICFAGHVDVVPIFDRSLWTYDPFQATTIGNKIYGRGAVDMKGAIACFLAASLDFIKLNPVPNGAISFLITSDEEGAAKYGTTEMLKYLHQDTDKLIDLAIVGEPTSQQQVGDTVKIGRRGSINFNLTIYGIAGHVAYPLLAKNPLPYLVEILNILACYQLDKGSEFFQQSNLELTSIDVGNNVSNVIPNKATARFNIRFNDLHSSATIIALVNSVISEYFAKYNLKYELTSVSSADCFIQEPIGLIADFVEVAATTTRMATKLSTDGGTSDARFIKNYCPVVEFGLKSDEAHKINEYTEIIDLQSLYGVYYNSLIKFLT
jgi:succinyl-diaminopimelate desuccinylase